MPTATTPITDTLISLLSHLVRFPTVTSDPATNRAALDWVEQQLDGLPMVVKRFESNGFPSLVATVGGTKNPRLWLAGHMDVVPGPVDSYRPVVRDGRLHGRGAHDMKFALAVFVALLQQLGSEVSNYDLGLMITCDEEVGGFDGVAHLLDNQGYRGGTVLIPDCNANWRLEMGAKGVMWWDLKATGRTAHSGSAWEGVNAIDELFRFVSALRSHVPSEPCHDPHHQHTTINLGTISGGTAANAVPASATARIDIRFVPSQTLAEITSWVEDAMAAVPTVKARVVVSDAPYRVQEDGPIHRFEEIVEEVTGHGMTKSISHGSSDARHFARYGVHSINVCPTGSGFHMPNEWVDVEDLGRFYEVTRRFVEDWSRR
jgi:succinyl-diaminopimelate desuccinylase